MGERLLLVTGHLAYPRLERLMRSLGETPFAWEICNIGVKVAALMTEAILLRRLPRPLNTDRILLPGRFRGDVERLTSEFGVAVARGPDEIFDLPAFFGRDGKAPDLSRYDIRIFAEIVDASALSIEAILSRAEGLRRAGADIIDLGCLPDTPFPHLEESVRALKAAGLSVSVNSSTPTNCGAAPRRGRISS